MDQKFLIKAQEAGWIVESVEEGSCIVKCPSAGCGMRARVKEKGDVPPRINNRVRLDFVAASFDAVRLFLRGRREDLRLNIAEVEEAAGLTVDHLAKFERDNAGKIPNVEMFLLWANALGFEVVLRPTDLPRRTLREIVNTRDRAVRRGRRNQIEQSRRLAGGRDPR